MTPAEGWMQPQPQGQQPTFNPTEISLCKDNCGCMTHTLPDSTCGKCGAVKGQQPDKITCTICGAQNVPDWDGKGHCISCARDLVLGQQPPTRITDPAIPVSGGKVELEQQLAAERERNKGWRMSKPTVVTFKQAYDLNDHEHSDSDEVVMRVKDIATMYVHNGSCYLQAENWDKPYQLPVREYDRIKEIFEADS